MFKKFKFGFKAKALSLVLAAGVAIGGLVPGLLSAPELPVSAQTSTQTTDYNLADNIQDGVILHCFDWKYTDIISELPNIAAAGFTSVQTSPAQVGASSGQWYWLYQPRGFYVGDNDLGTKEQLRQLCTEADKYGIKVIVDVVANHLAGDHSNIQGDLKDSQYWHNYGLTSDRINWSDRWQVTNGEIGMPDLNSEHPYVQQVVNSYVNELKGLGVDGIRWDAAKHISLPSEGCNFWPAVTSQGLYHYGEILVGPDDRSTGNEGLMKEYTNYMTVTDSSYGKTLREAFNSGTVPAAYGNWAARGISNDKLIYWGESHDTWANNKDWGYSNDMSQNVIDRAYAVAASRADITALYFSRPYSNVKDQIRGGQKGSTHFTSTEVAAINKFHNDKIGEKDYYTTGSNCAVVTRETGAVVVAGSGSNKYVTVPNGGGLTKPGTYKDMITGETWTVTATTMSGKIGSTGIAVLNNDDNNDDLITKEKVYYKNTNNWSTVKAYYWSDSNLQMTTWPGIQMTSIGNGEYSVEIPDTAKYIIFTDGNGNKTDDLTLQGWDKIYNNGTWSNYGETPEPNPEEKTVYYKNTNNWGTVKAYYWSDSNLQMIAWPGVDMTKVDGSVYSVEVPADAQYIIFTNGSGSQTDDLTIAGDNKLFDNGNWSDYSNEDPISVNNVVYYKNTNNWNVVKAYYWSDADTQMVSWPGVAMTSEGNSVYSVELPEGAQYIIFTNGNGSQTGDITLQGMGKIYNNGNWSNY